MFQFTTTNVINSNADLTTGKPLWSAQSAKDGKPANFHVKRVNNFLAPNVTAIYKAEANDPEMAKVTIDLSEINGTKGEQYRLNIYVGLTQASSDSRYSNDLNYKGKPFSIDFVWKGETSNTAEDLVKTIKKYEILVYGDKLLNISYSGTCITLEATTEYQRFRRVDIEKFAEEKHHSMGEYTLVRSLEDIQKVTSNVAVTATAEGFFEGKEGFGTYSFLLHNLRIPTSMRTRAFGINQDETPIVGAKYNQYTIYYCVNRGILGSNAVGHAVQSITTHVFYVNQTIASEFEQALSTVGTVTSVSAGTKTPNPGMLPVDVEELAQEVKTIKEALKTKQDTLLEGNGISISDNTVSVEVDGDTLTASAAGLKVTDNKFEPKA